MPWADPCSGRPVMGGLEDRGEPFPRGFLIIRG